MVRDPEEADSQEETEKVAIDHAEEPLVDSEEVLEVVLEAPEVETKREPPPQLKERPPPKPPPPLKRELNKEPLIE